MVGVVLFILYNNGIDLKGSKLAMLEKLKAVMISGKLTILQYITVLV